MTGPSTDIGRDQSSSQIRRPLSRRLQRTTPLLQMRFESSRHQ